MDVKSTAELYDAIEKALQADATAFQYITEPFSHSFTVKRLTMTDEELSEMLRWLNAGERVCYRVPATVEHRWSKGSESWAEELSYLADIELEQEPFGEETRLSIDAGYGAYWELIPQGSPGYMEYEDPWSDCPFPCF
jgi:hypothetical protein